MAESQGNPPPQGGQGGASGAPNGGEAKPFTFADEDEFNRRLNGAITGRLTEFGKKLDGRFGELQQGVAAYGARFDEIGKALEGLKPTPAADPKAKAEPAAFKLEDSPEWKAHQVEIAKLKQLAADTARERDTERAKTRASTLRTTLAEQLQKAGVPADRVKLAVGHLISAERLVDYADGGKGDEPVWREGEEERSLADGIKAFLKTSDGKLFLPPVNPGGSGGGPGRGAPPPSNNPAHQQTADLLGGIDSLLLGRTPSG